MIGTDGPVIVANIAIVPAALLLTVKAVHLLAARRVWISRHGPWPGMELSMLSASAGLCAYVPGLWLGFAMEGATALCLRGLGPPAGRGAGRRATRRGVDVPVLTRVPLE
ncbi:hypothetical protein [Streptomyces sp. NPDC018045]|uniref:hypothetical protein n=1 Tax=Streptomyces sp. NPDC018045 TaxID=3365037 RepID=UPI0037B3B13A